MKTDIRKQGFSLVEIMVAMVAAAILLLIVSLILVMPVRVMRTNKEYARVRRDMALAVEVMARDIREASLVVDDGFAAGANLLVLPRSTGLSGTTHRYEKSGDVLTRDGMAVAEGVRMFEAEPNADRTGIELELELEGNNGEIVITHEMFIHTRN